MNLVPRHDRVVFLYHMFPLPTSVFHLFARLSTLCQVKKDLSTLIIYLNYTMK
jgi:hypothetical protein